MCGRPLINEKAMHVSASVVEKGPHVGSIVVHRQHTARVQSCRGGVYMCTHHVCVYALYRHVCVYVWGE